jgi:calcium-translocating P-type ATPase
VRTRLIAARDRQDVVEALGPPETRAGEAALDDTMLCALLGSAASGLDAAEAARRLAACGANELRRAARRSLAARLAAQLTGFFAVLLWIGGALAFLVGSPEAGWAIFGVIVVNGVFSFVQEYRAERAIEALQALLPRRIAVRRDGTAVTIDLTAVVPGDVVELAEGDHVPADGRILAAAGLRVDQSALTGEAQPVFKLPLRADGRENVPRLERSELVFAGTSVVAGAGTLLVTATGMDTEVGGIAGLTAAVEETASPLQRELARATRVVTILAVAIGAGAFVSSVATRRLALGEAMLFALGVIVANVPEGLLPTLSLSLALAVQRLARAGTLMKRLSAVETLGEATVICTDKTGTLTLGTMVVRHLWVDGRVIAGEDGAARELLEAATLASLAGRDRGDPTEVAIVAAAARAGADPEALRAAAPIVVPYPFDSFRKRMTLVREGADGCTAWVKGASAETLALCTSIRRGGRTVALREAQRRAILAEHDRLAAEGLRMLAVAARSVADQPADAPAGAVERELTFLGLIALWDPPRPEVTGAIAACHRAGIRIVIVTGDHGLTARAIAGQIGLAATKIVTGAETEHLSAGALRALALEPGVLFARTSPAHKLAIVEALRAGGEVVAVTGDGVNDAPALKAADIGVAMGRRGTDVAKEASEMVLMRDDFTAIVAAVRLGRASWANIGKFVTYIFSSNFAELVPFLAFVLVRIPLPLNVMQILAIDLGTNILPGLALGGEAPEPGVMERPPRPPTERLLGRDRLLRAYGFLGAAEAALSMAAFFWVYWLDGWRPGLPLAAEGPVYLRASTMAFAGIVAAQVGNVFACRTDRASVFSVGVVSNRMVGPAVLVEIGLLVVFILVPPFPAILGVAPLSVQEWGILVLFPFVLVGLDEGRKWLARVPEPRAQETSSRSRRASSTSM